MGREIFTYKNDIKYYSPTADAEFDLKTKDGMWIREANFHRWEWTPRGATKQFGQAVNAWSREPLQYSTTLIFHGTQNDRAMNINLFHKAIEGDVRNMTPGTLYFGDWYLTCYITSSSTTADAKEWTANEVMFFAPYPFWLHDTWMPFNKSEPLPKEDDEGNSYPFLDYVYDYDYDYSAIKGGLEYDMGPDPLYAGTDFLMRIYGPVRNPSITITAHHYEKTYPAHTYQVLHEVKSGEWIEIDSRNKTIYLKDDDGIVENLFPYRSKEQSVFEPLPPGLWDVNWSGLFWFELIAYEEASEPRNDFVTRGGGDESE